MIKDQFEKVKSLVVKNENKNTKKTIENLVAFVIILIITIIAINTIWKKDSKSENTKNTTNNIEEKLKNILSKIDGVGEVDVLITYSNTSEIVPLYNEDSKESTTEETDKEGGTRRINESTSKKDIIYKENNGEKEPITRKHSKSENRRCDNNCTRSKRCSS